MTPLKRLRACEEQAAHLRRAVPVAIAQAAKLSRELEDLDREVRELYRQVNEPAGIAAHIFMSDQLADRGVREILVQIERLAGKAETLFEHQPQQRVARARIRREPGNRRRSLQALNMFVWHPREGLGLLRPLRLPGRSAKCRNASQARAFDMAARYVAIAHARPGLPLARDLDISGFDIAPEPVGVEQRCCGQVLRQAFLQSLQTNRVARQRQSQGLILVQSFRCQFRKAGGTKQAGRDTSGKGLAPASQNRQPGRKRVGGGDMGIVGQGVEKQVREPVPGQMHV